MPAAPIFVIVDDKHVPVYRIMWVSDVPHFCGDDECQCEGDYEIRLESHIGDCTLVALCDISYSLQTNFPESGCEVAWRIAQVTKLWLDIGDGRALAHCTSFTDGAAVRRWLTRMVDEERVREACCNDYSMGDGR